MKGFRRIVAIGIMALWPAARCDAIGQAQYVTTAPEAGAFAVVAGKRAANLYVDANDWPGVARAAGDLQADIGRVSGSDAKLVRDADSLGASAIIIGTIGKSAVIDRLIQDKKIDAGAIAGKWETFFLQTVAHPLPGVESALVIAGSDKRGTIYGIYDLSEQIGVSPWYWWDDVQPRHLDAIFVRPGKYQQGEPSVKYRGIFLNDESPDLTNWVRGKFGTVPNMNGVANYNSKFYARVFELLLRLKANYLWPAMWNNAFNEDDPENPKLADEYGIVMGTSHQEPMLRAQKEWDRRNQRTIGSWNYFTHPAELEQFWREGVRRNKNFESILTIGLRGANDTPMIAGGSAQQSVELLGKIIAAQRSIIAQEINPDVTKVPQLWCPYKEVLDYYNAGFRVPDDVTLLWTDDNWGNLRRLPTSAERSRPGGAGIYYHFDYHGGPRNYQWINTSPISKVWEQMSLAKEYGADRIWIVNVGHLKGQEIPTEFFMSMAWNSTLWNGANLDDYTRQWAAREFGPAHAAEIAEIVTSYTKFNNRRKPELLEPATYSVANYQEADRVAAEYAALADKAQKISDALPAEERDAFYELVLFPVKASAQVTEMYVTAGKNKLYAAQGRARAILMAARTQAMFQADADLMKQFNTELAGGAWNHFMDQVHIGYTSWNEPRQNIAPRTTTLKLVVAGSLGVGEQDTTFDSFNRQRRFLYGFNMGQTAFEFKASADQPWIVLDKTVGIIDGEDGVWTSIDWAKAPPNRAEGTVTIAQTGGKSVGIKISEFNPPEPTRESLDGYVEADGYVSIEAEHFTKKTDAGESRWERLPDYGRTLSAMRSIAPLDSAAAVPPEHSACLEYRMYLFNPAHLKANLVVAPTLNFVPGRGGRLALSMDDQPPRVVTLVPEDYNAQNGNRDWEKMVSDSARWVQADLTASKAGYHILKVWMVDPAVVLEKVIIDTGGLKPSYLGPPESYRNPPADSPAHGIGN